MILLPEKAMEWARAEWALRKGLIQDVYAGRKTWHEIDDEMAKAIADSGFDELLATQAIILVQQEDTEAERRELAKKARRYVSGLL